MSLKGLNDLLIEALAPAITERCVGMLTQAATMLEIADMTDAATHVVYAVALLTPEVPLPKTLVDRFASVGLKTLPNKVLSKDEEDKMIATIIAKQELARAETGTCH